MTTVADAILAVVRAAMPGDVVVFDSIVPGVAPARYVVMYIPEGARASQSVDAVSDCVSLTFSSMSVVSDWDPTYAMPMCRVLATMVRDSLVDAVVVADGLAPARIVQKGSQNPNTDESTPDKKVYSTAQFSLETVRIS